MKSNIISNLEDTFQIIKDTLRYNRKKEDKLVEKMYDDASGILFEISSVYQKDKKDLEESFVEKIKKFYSNENYLIFTNYNSETDENEIYNNIDINFL